MRQLPPREKRTANYIQLRASAFPYLDIAKMRRGVLAHFTRKTLIIFRCIIRIRCSIPTGEIVMPIRSNISMVGNEPSSPGYWNVRFFIRDTNRITRIVCQRWKRRMKSWDDEMTQFGPRMTIETDNVVAHPSKSWPRLTLLIYSLIKMIGGGTSRSQGRPHTWEHTQFVPGGHPSKCGLHPPWLDFSDPMIIRDFILVRPPQQS